jgi:hypothetical protein
MDRGFPLDINPVDTTLYIEGMNSCRGKYTYFPLNTVLIRSSQQVHVDAHKDLRSVSAHT